ncbi:hypothetical protein LZ30DRAFT_210565 [Colletotrichum cereale]|nr:hypothetical protein LZ30DRAFT_210565 [Colletotrichum cereale]
MIGGCVSRCRIPKLSLSHGLVHVDRRHIQQLRVMIQQQPRKGVMGGTPGGGEDTWSHGTQSSQDSPHRPSPVCLSSGQVPRVTWPLGCHEVEHTQKALKILKVEAYWSLGSQSAVQATDNSRSGIIQAMSKKQRWHLITWQSFGVVRTFYCDCGRSLRRPNIGSISRSLRQ